jgi:hypothetical protein
MLSDQNVHAEIAEIEVEEEAIEIEIEVRETMNAEKIVTTINAFDATLSRVY